MGARFKPVAVMWRLLAAPETLMALMGVIALVLILAELIPQAPPGTANSPQAWIAAQTGPIGQQSGLLRSLGLFDLYHSLGFRVLLALIGLCLFVRAVESGELAWSLSAQDRRIEFPWFPHGRSAWDMRLLCIDFSPLLPEDRIAVRLRQYFSRHGYWTTALHDGRLAGYLAGRHTALLWAWPIGYAGLLVALLGLVITDTWGWFGEPWQPLPGESRVVGQTGPYALRLDTFDVRSDGGRSLCDFRSHVTWLEGDRELEPDLIRIGFPASKRSGTVRQLGFVPVVRMRGWDGEGQPLTLETDADALSVTGVAEIRFTSPESQPLVLVTGHDLYLALSFEPNCAIGEPELHLSRIESGGAGQVTVGTLRKSGTVSVNEFRLDIDLRFVPILRSDFRPGQGAVIAGLVLFLTAGLALWFIPPRLVRIVEDNREARDNVVRVLALARVGDSAWWTRMADDFQETPVDET